MGALYRLLRPLLELLARIAELFSPSLRKAMQGRRAWRKRLPDDLGGAGGGSRLWIHAPSLGELLLVEEVLRELPPQPLPHRILVTVTSPSAVDRASEISQDVRGVTFLPPDGRGPMRELLGRFKPSLIVIGQYDLWPNMIWEANAQGVPMALIGAALRSDSSKSKGPPRSLYRDLYGRQTYIAAISKEDAGRLVALGARRESVEVTGDPRVDRAARLADELSVADLPLPEDRPWLVAGSTHESDEALLLPATKTAREPMPELGLAIAPHDVTEARLKHIERAADRLGLSHSRFSALGPGVVAPDVVVVDRFGLLTTLYARANIAYVGGGYGRGVHNVLEPAARGVPVLFGPKHANAREAVQLVECGGAFVAGSSADLSVQIEEWLMDRDGRRKAGDAARKLIERSRGSARRTAIGLCKRFPKILGEPPTE